MSCGYWLRLNGTWVALPGVQKDVPRNSERASSSITSIEGVRHSQSARRVNRSWTLDFGHAGPEAVTALAVAAQGDGIDVMLWDESIARQNLLDPVPLVARPGYPVVMCGVMPLVSLTAGPLAAEAAQNVPLKANLTIWSGGESKTLEAGDGLDLLVKASIPRTEEGLALVGADLILTGTGTAAMDVHAASNAWIEPADTFGNAGYFTSVPAGDLLGSAGPVDGVWTIPLPAPTTFEGSDMSLRIVGDDVAVNVLNSRNAASGVPVLRLTYAVLAEDRTFSQRLRPGTYTLAAWTDAPAGTQIGTLTLLWAGAPATGPINIPAGSGTGWRYVAIDLPPLADPLDVDVVLFDSTDYLLAGVMLSSLPTPGVYMAPQKTPVSVRVQDPTFVLNMLLGGQQGQGPRTATLEEVGT